MIHLTVEEIRSMKTTIKTLVLIIGFSVNSVLGQVTQIEFTSGFSKTDFTLFSVKKLDRKERFMMTNLAFFQKYHRVENFDFDEGGVQTTGFWNFSDHLSIGPSLYYNSVIGFSERLSLMGRIMKEEFMIAIIPTAFHSELNGNFNGELFIQIQYKRSLKEPWNYVLNAQLLSSWDKFSVHGRSFQQIRTGVSYKNTQFGFALDLDQYGPKPVTKTMVGIFIKLNFFDK